MSLLVIYIYIYIYVYIYIYIYIYFKDWVGVRLLYNLVFANFFFWRTGKLVRDCFFQRFFFFDFLKEFFFTAFLSMNNELFLRVTKPKTCGKSFDVIITKYTLRVLLVFTVYDFWAFTKELWIFRLNSLLTS